MMLRLATVSDLPYFRLWAAQPDVAETVSDFASFDWAGEIPRTVDWREILIAEIDGRPIGVMQIIDPAREESHYWGDVAPNLRAIDIWIGLAKDRGHGYGTQMMQKAIERCFAQPEVQAIIIDPLAGNMRAHSFYQRLGFRGVEHRIFGTDECFVHRLERPAPGTALAGQGE
jgi:aminoglycoside 6'-N-acetyltransferase